MRVVKLSAESPILNEASEGISRMRARLLRWFKKNARQLPWRVPPVGDALGTDVSHLRRSPYAAWVAEIMLQQTQVSTVVPYFEKWMRKFPDPEVLARASEDEVLRSWAGLGYYARARNLHRAARILSGQGAYPVSLEGWRALPGIGAYTAGAIASLALNLPEPILDGNVARVLSRVFGLAFLPDDGIWQRDAYWKLARQWSQTPRPGDTNEALMELGALVCVPVEPRCKQCPLASGCKARLQGLQKQLPPSKHRPRVETVTGVVLVLENRNRILMQVRPKGGFLAGHLSFPLFLGGEEKHWKKGILPAVSGWEWERSDEVGTVRHAIMNKRYSLKVLKAKIRVSEKGIVKADTDSLRWIRISHVDEILTNSLARKIWKLTGP